MFPEMFTFFGGRTRGHYWRDHAARCLTLRHGPCLRDRPNHLRTIEPQNQVSWCPQHRVTPTQSIYVTCCYVYSVYETHFWKNILISMFQLMCCMSLSKHDVKGCSSRRRCLLCSFSAWQCCCLYILYTPFFSVDMHRSQVKCSNSYFDYTQNLWLWRCISDPNCSYLIPPGSSHLASRQHRKSRMRRLISSGGENSTGLGLPTLQVWVWVVACSPVPDLVHSVCRRCGKQWKLKYSCPPEWDIIQRIF